jgi:mannose-6-phosphate isomerase-like protein (cupin superfamily)
MRHSEDHKTIYPSDIFYRVLEGTLVLADPEHGEVIRAQAGDSVFFRRDMWHHAFNYSRRPLKILEFAAPPAGEAIHYAKEQRPLLEVTYVQKDAWRAWPDSGERRKNRRIKVISDEDILWCLWGTASQTLIGVLASTEHLTIAELELLPGSATDEWRLESEMTLFALSGILGIEIQEPDSGATMFELNPWDGFYLPAKTSFRLSNLSGDSAKLIFQVVPGLAESGNGPWS